MLRLIGSVMVATGCIGLGIWYRQQFVQRLYHLRCLDKIVEMMMSEVRFGKATLPECCSNLAERLEEPYRQAFEEMFSYCQENSGESFGQVFQEKMERCFAHIPLHKEEKKLFLEFASESGFEDGRMQLRSMEQYHEILQKTIIQQEAELAEKSRMALGLGTMGGLLLVIILW